jgi:cyanophycinase-like exopeptidase
MSGFVYLLAGNPRARSGKPDPAMCAFFRELGKGSPCVAYVGTASGDDGDFFEAMRNRLLESGAGEVALMPLCGAAANPVEARRVLAQADAVFVSGGDVAEGMGGLAAQEGLVAALHERFASGTPFMGLSAGSIMLARGWVRWAEAGEGVEQDTVFDCLGFAPLYCDVHDEGDGWGELASLLRLLPDSAVGYAIPAGGALRFCDGVVSSVGSGRPASIIQSSRDGRPNPSARP